MSFPQNANYSAPLYCQYPPPFQNPTPAPQPPPQMPPRPAQFPPASQYPQPQVAQRSQRAPAPRDRGETLPLRQLLLNEEVIVNLHARGWVMGMVLATVKLANAIAGWGYKIQFTPPGKNFVEVDTFPHHSDSIRLP